MDVGGGAAWMPDPRTTRVWLGTIGGRIGWSPPSWKGLGGELGVWRWSRSEGTQRAAVDLTQWSTRVGAAWTPAWSEHWMGGAGLAGTATYSAVTYRITDGKTQSRQASQLVWGAAAMAMVTYRMAPLEIRAEIPLLINMSGRIDVTPAVLAGISF